MGWQRSAFSQANSGAWGNLKLPETEKLLADSSWLLARQSGKRPDGAKGLSGIGTISKPSAICRN
jgi:hypothetical protein